MSDENVGNAQFTVRPSAKTIDAFRAVEKAVYPERAAGSQKPPGNWLAARILDAIAAALLDGNQPPSSPPLVTETWSKFHAKPSPPTLPDIRSVVRGIIEEMEAEKKNKSKQK